MFGLKKQPTRAKRRAKIVVVQLGGGTGWFWYLQGGRGAVLASSETYKHRADCLRGIERTKAAIGPAKITIRGES